MLTLGKPKKNFFIYFNGLYTPFGSPVIGGQKRLIAFLSLSLIPLRGLLDRLRLRKAQKYLTIVEFCRDSTKKKQSFFCFRCSKIWLFVRLDLRSKMLTLGKSKKNFRLLSLNRIFVTIFAQLWRK